VKSVSYILSYVNNIERHNKVTDVEQFASGLRAVDLNPAFDLGKRAMEISYGRFVVLSSMQSWKVSMLFFNIDSVEVTHNQNRCTDIKILMEFAE
jgi:hypothetical protein